MKPNRIGTIIGVIFCVLLLPFAAVSGTLEAKSYIRPEKISTFLATAS
jgi:hypothetical protein